MASPQKVCCDGEFDRHSPPCACGRLEASSGLNEPSANPARTQVAKSRFHPGRRRRGPVGPAHADVVAELGDGTRVRGTGGRDENVGETRRSSGADGADSGMSRGKIRALRSWCVYLATTVGLVCAVVSWGLGGVVISMVTVAMAAAVLASSMWGGNGWSSTRRIVRVTCAAALITPAAVGLIAVCGLAGVLVVLLLAATTPALTSLVRKRRPAPADPVVRPEPLSDPATRLAAGHAPAEELRALDDVALCLAWRRSFRLLEASRSATERMVVVEQRQQYLDELHRRSPEGLAAWLNSGARASGNPLPYVDDARRRAG